MRKSGITSVSVVLTAAAISLPFLASAAAGATVSVRATTAVGKQLAELKGSDTVKDNDFGFSVAISGTTAVVGAPAHAAFAGRAYVFTKTAKGWKQAAELKGSDTVANDYFGGSVAISGTTAVIGAPDHGKYAGRVYVFTKTAKGWKQAAELKGSDTVASDLFGGSVAISGTSVMVGADEHAAYADRAYVFTKTAKGWKQAAELKGSDTVAGDQFGKSVAISGTTAVVGANSHAKIAGRAYVFTKTAKGWKQAAELKGSDTVASDLFGASVAISGTTAVVGAANHAGAGRAYVFTKTAKGWKQRVEVKGSDTAANDEFGFSVAISGTTAVAGANVHALYAGRAYLFEA